MDVIRTYVKEQLPAYLRSLPIPATVAGFAQLSGEDWLRLAPLLLLSGSLVALVVLQFVEPRRARPAINTIRPGPKHVDKVPLKEVENSKSDNVSFCRCWQSKKFPYCDGSHNAFNAKEGQTLGPLVISKAAA